MRIKKNRKTKIKKEYSKEELKISKYLLIVSFIITIFLFILFKKKLYIYESNDKNNIKQIIEQITFYDNDSLVFANITIFSEEEKICELNINYANFTKIENITILRGRNSYSISLPNMPIGSTKVYAKIKCD